MKIAFTAALYGVAFAFLSVGLLVAVAAGNYAVLLVWALLTPALP